ncbi:MAG: hypothetical protein V3V34_11875 [Kiloniellales bacterium]
MTDVVIIAEAPGEKDAPPDGPTWGRLAELAGVRDVRQICRPATLFGWPCKPTPAALRSSADHFPLEGRIVVLGRRVAAAFRVAKADALEWTELGGAQIAYFPTPSGANRWWNADKHRAAAVAFLRGLPRAAAPKPVPEAPTARAPEQPADILARRHNESGQAWLAFEAYMVAGAARSFAGVCEALERPPRYIRQLKKWGGRHDWQARAREYDTRALRQSMAGREDQAEAARQALYDEALEAALFVGEVRRGLVDSGKGAPPVSTRLQAALQALDRIGVSAHKRTELVHFDGDLMPAASEAMRGLTDEEIRAFATLGAAPPIGERH